MKIALGGDHRGAAAAKQLAESLKARGHDVVVAGMLSGETCDYPIPAHQVGTLVAAGKAERGILICGTGIGTCIAANKVKGVRAALVHDELTAQISRSHNDANIICLSADLLGQRLIEKITDVWLVSPFEGGRHARRLRRVAAMEEGKDPAATD
ncbi:MAG: ribose 5-phosphate isomerase B [Phycisphaerae bacterium]|nr:ribose 5-phosphate isomerase B [Phycisphaerae bacterium]